MNAQETNLQSGVVSFYLSDDATGIFAKACVCFPGVRPKPSTGTDTLGHDLGENPPRLLP